MHLGTFSWRVFSYSGHPYFDKEEGQTVVQPRGKGLVWNYSSHSFGAKVATCWESVNERKFLKRWTRGSAVAPSPWTALHCSFFQDLLLALWLKFSPLSYCPMFGALTNCCFRESKADGLYSLQTECKLAKPLWINTVLMLFLLTS